MSGPVDNRVASWVVDQQLQSPLFTLLPTEIHLAIFRLALGPHIEDAVVHDFRLRHNHGDPRTDGALSESAESAQFTDVSSVDNSEDGVLESGSEGSSGIGGENEEVGRPFLAWELDDDDDDDGSFRGDATTHPDRDPEFYTWARPDAIGVEKPITALLRTCRRAYVEARDHRPKPDYVFRAWSNASGPPSVRCAYNDRVSATDFIRGLTTDQRNSVISARFFCFDAPLAPILRSLALRRIEHLRITLLHDAQRPHTFSPFNPWGDADLFDDNFQRTEQFGLGAPPPESPDADWAPPVVWGIDGWAAALRFAPRLQELVVDFDASEENRNSVAARVEWAARAWRFPLWSPRPDNCTYLSAAGNPISNTSWRGFPEHLPGRCSDCFSGFTVGFGWPLCMCPRSNERLGLAERGLRPRMYTWTVRWTPRVGKPWVVPFEEDALPDGRWKWEEGGTSGRVPLHRMGG